MALPEFDEKNVLGGVGFLNLRCIKLSIWIVDQ